MNQYRDPLEGLLFTHSKEYAQLKSKYLKFTKSDVQNYLFDLLDDGFQFELIPRISNKKAGVFLSDDWESNKGDYQTYYRLQVHKSLEKETKIGLTSHTIKIYRYDQYQKWVTQLNEWNEDMEVVTKRICDDFDLEIYSKYFEGQPLLVKGQTSNLPYTYDNKVCYIFTFYGPIIPESEIEECYNKFVRTQKDGWALKGIQQASKIFADLGFQNAADQLDYNPSCDNYNPVDMGFMGLDDIVTVGYVDRTTGVFEPDMKGIEDSIQAWNEQEGNEMAGWHKNTNISESKINIPIS